jgi:Rrf2 family nitric oxide-sensitive transcriptional repressor
MLSQTTEYALRAMSCLAYAPDELTPTPVLARYTKVPSNYLAKVLQLLAQSELIVGRRGVGGGYKLAKPAADISMLDVVNAIDPVRRIESCPLGLPNHGGTLCAMHCAVDRAAAHLLETFDGVTMADLVAEAGGNRPLCDTELAERLAVTMDGSAIGNPLTANAGAEGNGNGHAGV